MLCSTGIDVCVSFNTTAIAGTRGPKARGRRHGPGGAGSLTLIQQNDGTQPPICPSVGDAIGVKYASLGGCNSFLGKAISAELPGQGGRYARFEGGDIYWSPATDAHVIKGAIEAVWTNLGAERSPLGFPTTGEFDFLFGRVNLFQHGFIYYNPAIGIVPFHW